MKRTWPLALLALLVVGLPAGSAGATILIKKDLARLAAECEVVALGRIVDRNSAYAEGTNLIFSHWTLVVEKTLKGAPASRLRITEIGGTVGEVTLRVAGAADFAIGELVFVFLKRDALGQLRPHGFVQGRFSVMENRFNESRIVRLDPALAHVHAAAIAPALRNAAGNVDLEDFEDAVAALVETAAAKAAEKKEAGR